MKIMSLVMKFHVSRVDPGMISNVIRIYFIGGRNLKFLSLLLLPFPFKGECNPELIIIRGFKGLLVIWGKASSLSLILMFGVVCNKGVYTPEWWKTPFLYSVTVNVCILVNSFIYWMRMIVLNSIFIVPFIFLDQERGTNWFLLQILQILAWHLQLGKRYKDMDWCEYNIIQENISRPVSFLLELLLC